MLLEKVTGESWFDFCLLDGLSRRSGLVRYGDSASCQKQGSCCVCF